jgi:DNA polymerase-1
MATELFPAGAADVLYLVDLSSYVLRAYHAIAPLSSPTGEPTHAVHGTVSMLERLLRERRPALFGIAMDSGRATFRKQIYDGYKANRPPAPDDLRQQMQRLEQVVRAFNVAILKLDGMEADDLIAACVKQARARGIRVVVVAADKDLMQLVGPDVVLYDTMRDKVFGVAEVEERFGVRIDQLRDLLALTGDSSDNIPGVASVGPKTAKDLLVEYGTLDGIYQHLEQIQRKALREALTTHKEKAFLSQQLVTLKDDCWTEFDGESFARRARDVPTLRVLYTELGFHRQLAQLDNEPAAFVPTRSAPEPAREPEPITLTAGPKTTLVRDLSALSSVVSQVARAKRCAVEIFTDLPRPARGRVVGISLAVEPGSVAYVPIAHRHMVSGVQLPLSQVREQLRPLLADPSIKKVGLDLKNSAVAAERDGLPIVGFTFDAGLASYLLDPEGRHDRESLAQRELGIVTESYDDLTKRGRTKLAFDELAPDEALGYATASAHFALLLEQRMAPRLAEEGLSRLFDEIELPLAELLARMELTGVRIDSAVLAAIGKDCERDLERLEKEAHRIAGDSFNVNSPRQLETLLFDKFGLKPLKRTKTSRSTDAATLEALADQHELPRVILEIRQLAKLKGTYIDALPALVHKETGRIHSSWEQAVAATGRLSSSDPNLQNIPIRTELGRKIRAAFTAPPECELVSADYSQIELRVLAHLSQDPAMLDAFRTGQDIHTRTAMEIFEVDEQSVTREHRTRAKAVNFGVIYGQGDSGLAKVLGISRAEASSFIAAYFRRYEGVRKFMNETLERARAGEAVKTLFGRRRLVPTIGSANRAERLAAERIAMNMPIQGTAADILKLAMLALREPVTSGARMVLTVHDELVFEVPKGEVEAAVPAIRTKMETAVPLDVPLDVDVGHGSDWNAAH